MFDTFKMLYAGWTGAWKGRRDAASLMWPLHAVFIFNILCAVFAAAISYRAYVALANNNPTIGLAATLGVAFTVWACSLYVGKSLIHASRGERDQFHAGTMALLFLLGITLGVMDYYMNLSGADAYVVQTHALPDAPDTQGTMSRYGEQIQGLQDERKGIMNKYSWNGNVSFKPSKWRPAAEYNIDKQRVTAIDQQVSSLESLQSQELGLLTTTGSMQLQDVGQMRQMVQKGLYLAVKWVYVAMLVLSLAGASITRRLQDLRDVEPDDLTPTPSSPRKPAPGSAPAGTTTPPEPEDKKSWLPWGRSRTDAHAARVADYAARDADTRRVTPETEAQTPEYSLVKGGFPIDCKQCSTRYYAQRKPVAGEYSFCSDACRSTFHANKRKASA